MSIFFKALQFLYKRKWQISSFHSYTTHNALRWLSWSKICYKVHTYTIRNVDLEDQNIMVPISLDDRHATYV